jgi:AcrR family transcriptional regulator
VARSAGEGKPAVRPLALRSVDRAIERRRATYEDEVRRLLRAGFELVRRKGVLEPRVDEIVAEAGLSNQTFYRHFGSKDELLLALLDDGIRTLRSYVDHRMSKARTPERKIRSWLAGVLEQALNEEAARATRPFAVSRARLSERFPEEVGESEAQLTALLRAAIQEAVDAGELPHADPQRDSELVHALAMAWLERKLAEAAPARRADAEHLIEFALHGLKRRS